jgi:hypothetical protein
LRWTIGVFDRQGAEANGIDELKNGRIGADAEGVRENGNHDKSWRLREGPHAVA